MRNAILCLLICAGLVVSACGSPTAPGATGSMGSQPPSATPTVTAVDLAFCVSETNRYRAMVNRPLLTRSAALEAFATDGAKVDAERGIAHFHFDNNPGVARAENESVRSLTSRTVREAIADSILAYWNEGPTGPHYQNLVGAFTELGCGGDVRNGILTFVQDFR